MRILHVTPAFYPATYWGGPIISLYELCNALAEKEGVEIRVLTSDSAGPSLGQRIRFESQPLRYDAGYEVHFHRRIWGHSFSPGMLARLGPHIRWADVVHLTGVYSPPTIPALMLATVLRKPVVWSPRGALQRWEGSTRRKLKDFWDGICTVLAGLGICVLHVTSEEERRASAERIPTASIATIPNGVTVPPLENQRKWRPGSRLRLLFIGRLHPIKGIENLFSALKHLPNEILLTVCGTGDPNYVSALKERVHDLGLAGRIAFKGHVTGKAKKLAFMHADVCVVPSYTENFAMVVVEALAHGVPVIASRGTPWPQIEARGCGYWVDNDPRSLAEAIHRISKEDLAAMGERGRRWMEQSYSWSAIAEQMVALYRRSVQSDGRTATLPH